MAEVKKLARHNVSVVNETDVDTDLVMQELNASYAGIQPLLSWALKAQAEPSAPHQRAGGILSRDRFVTPSKVFDQFRTARDAATSDDIVSGALEATEALAFKKITFSCDEPDEENVWDQIAQGIDLESRMREIWRELFICSQCYPMVWWGTRTIRLKGKSREGVTRKKVYNNLRVPLGLTLLDATKVVPVGNLMFNKEQLAYVADQSEVDVLNAAIAGDPEADEIAKALVIKKYEPASWERRMFADQGITSSNLYLLNPKNVWRHSLTRSQFQRWADVRLVSVFELLDLKQQLRQNERTMLMSSTNFILLIKKGDDKAPGRPEEIASLQSQVGMLARVPVIVSDQRLSVEIVTPKADHILQNEKHSTIDNRIQARLYQMFLLPSAKGSDDSIKLAKVICRGLEARREGIRRNLDKFLLDVIFNANDELKSEPTMTFHPTRIQLDLDPTWGQFIMDLRDRGDISRETELNEFDFDQEDEARRREREAQHFDKVFTPTNVPYDGSINTPGKADIPVNPKRAGRAQGGLRNGGGASQVRTRGRGKGESE